MRGWRERARKKKKKKLERRVRACCVPRRNLRAAEFEFRICAGAGLYKIMGWLARRLGCG